MKLSATRITVGVAGVLLILGGGKFAADSQKAPSRSGTGSVVDVYQHPREGPELRSFSAEVTATTTSSRAAATTAHPGNVGPGEQGQDAATGEKQTGEEGDERDQADREGDTHEDPPGQNVQHECPPTCDTANGEQP